MSLASVLAQLSRGGGLPQRFRPFANQAANEAYLRFAPEWEGLNQLRAQSASTMRQNVGQANSAAQLISALANEGQRTLNATSNPLVQRLAAYDNPPAGSSSAVVAQSLGLGHDAISGMLGQAALNAPLRAAQQAQQALAAHQQDLEQIGGKRASLAGQVGAFTQGRLGDLVGDDRKLRHDSNTTSRKIKAQLDETNARLEVTKRGQDIASADRKASIQQRREAAKNRNKAKPGDIPNPGNIKLAPPATQAAQVAKINGAYANVKTLMSHPQAVKSEVETLLRAGKVDGVKYTQDQIDVAFDRFRNRGGISNRGARKLHTMGVSVRGHYGPAKPQAPRGGGITGNLVSRVPS